VSLSRKYCGDSTFERVVRSKRGKGHQGSPRRKSPASPYHDVVQKEPRKSGPGKEVASKRDQVVQGGAVRKKTILLRSEKKGKGKRGTYTPPEGAASYYSEGRGGLWEEKEEISSRPDQEQKRGNLYGRGEKSPEIVDSVGLRGKRRRGEENKERVGYDLFLPGKKGRGTSTISKKKKKKIPATKNPLIAC